MAHASVTVTCEGEAYLDEFDTEDLIEELERRKCDIKENHDALIEIYDAMKDRRIDDAIIMLERFLWPKWKSEAACSERLKELKKQASK
jgi:hypothetical protein